MYVSLWHLCHIMSALIIKFEPPGEIPFTCNFWDPVISYMNMVAFEYLSWKPLQHHMSYGSEILCCITSSKSMQIDVLTWLFFECIKTWRPNKLNISLWLRGTNNKPLEPQNLSPHPLLKKSKQSNVQVKIWMEVRFKLLYSSVPLKHVPHIKT